MWRVVLHKELRELLRSDRLTSVVLATVVLLAAGLATATTIVRAHHQQVARATNADDAVFAAQGVRSPHAAAHFGRFAFKPLAPFAVFDPGVTAYLGQAIWLEAHTRSPAMFRPAEDAPALSRLSDFSVAGILVVLLPLLVMIVGAPAFAAERAQGTLRMVLGTGTRLRDVWFGKLLATSGVGVTIAIISIVCTTAVITAVGLDTPHGWARATVLMVGYSLYAIGFAAVSLTVSAVFRSPASAQLGVLALWTLMVVVTPRAAATVAQQRHPAPDAPAFWAKAQASIRAARPAVDSDRFRAAARMAISTAMGRRLTAAETASIAVNRAALRLEVSEMVGYRAFQALYRSLFATYANQRAVARWFALVSPSIALRGFSTALCSTDTAAHRGYSDAAERTRRAVIQRINQDMLLNGAGQGFEYKAGAKLWADVPTFVGTQPSLAAGIRRAAPDIAVLVGWVIAAVCISGWVVRRQVREDNT